MSSLPVEPLKVSHCRIIWRHMIKIPFLHHFLDSHQCVSDLRKRKCDAKKIHIGSHYSGNHWVGDKTFLEWTARTNCWQNSEDFSWRGGESQFYSDGWRRVDRAWSRYDQANPWLASNGGKIENTTTLAEETEEDSGRKKKAKSGSRVGEEQAEEITQVSAGSMFCRSCSLLLAIAKSLLFRARDVIAAGLILGELSEKRPRFLEADQGEGKNFHERGGGQDTQANQAGGEVRWEGGQGGEGPRHHWSDGHTWIQPFPNQSFHHLCSSPCWTKT